VVGEGKDFVDGARGSDRMLGEGGGDFLVDGPLGEGSKNDVLSGGEGDDILLGDHVPAVRDIVSCGGGFDRVVADSKDVVADDCKKVRVVHGSKAEVRQQEDAFFKSLPPAQRKFFDTFFDKQLAPSPIG
jgi:RTX calcium-binding nonapeptide repeat (4 copies)